MPKGESAKRRVRRESRLVRSVERSSAEGKGGVSKARRRTTDGAGEERGHSPWLIEAHAVSKSYGEVAALSAVSLQIDAGRIHALVGPNGAGKTTLIDVLTRVAQPDRGTVRHNTQALYELARPLLSLAPQETAVYPLSARRNVYYEARLAGLGRAEAKRAAKSLLEVLGMSGRDTEVNCDQLSGGMRRRVHLAMTMVRPAAIYFLDEPTVGLDVNARAGLLEWLRHFSSTTGSAVFMSTHYPREVEMIADDVTFLSRGRIVAAGKPHDLLKRAAKHLVYASLDQQERRSELLTVLRGAKSRGGKLGTFGNGVIAEVRGQPELFIERIRAWADAESIDLDVRLMKTDLEGLFQLHAAKDEEKTTEVALSP